MNRETRHPLPHDVRRLELPDDDVGEPALRFSADPGAPSPPTAPAALHRLRGDAVRLGSLPRDDDERDAPCPGVGETARRLAAGDVDPVRLVEAALRRVARLDPELRCFTTVTPDPARERARRLRDARRTRGEHASGSLAGTLIGHKDLLITAGIPTRAGSALLADCVPRHDAEAVARLRQAGAISLGKLATHEFATGITGLVGADPPARNPWGHHLVPGGSSSGSAVAVAAGLVAAATGTDTGGSIRIPAACCGVVGLKPTYGHVSRRGVIPFAWSLDHVGPLARSIEDVGLILDALHGSRPRRRDDGQRSSRPLRFALPAPFLRASSDRVADAVCRTAEELERVGAVRREVELPPEVEQVPAIAMTIFLAEGYSVHATTLESHPDAYCPETRDFLQRGADVSAERYLAAQRLRARLRDRMAEAMRDVDVLLLPTLPVVAPSLDSREVRIGGESVPVRAALTRFTRLANLTGQPAASLPCDDGEPPVAIQVLGQAGGEEAVLAAGALVEQVSGGTRWPPGLDGRG